MQIEFTGSDIAALLAAESEEHDLVRLVNPGNQRVFLPKGLRESDELCTSIWGREERCENCASLRAFASKGKAYKLETAHDKAYFVSSRYAVIDGRECVIETVDEVTESLFVEDGVMCGVGKIIERYNHLIVTDYLTGLYNRRFLDGYFTTALEYSEGRAVNVNVAMLDIDRFKMVNDVYGHQAGDAVLASAAAYWKGIFDRRAPNADRLVCRYGGDEFVIIACGESPSAFASEMAACSSKFPGKIRYGANEISYSMSYGIASSESFGPGWKWVDLIASADKMLYKAKAGQVSKP
jgi:putative two-component system response regulator